MTTSRHYWPLWWKSLTLVAAVGASYGSCWLLGLGGAWHYAGLLVFVGGASVAYDKLEDRHRPAKLTGRTAP